MGECLGLPDRRVLQAKTDPSEPLGLLGLLVLSVALALLGRRVTKDHKATSDPRGLPVLLEKMELMVPPVLTVRPSLWKAPCSLSVSCLTVRLKAFSTSFSTPVTATSPTVTTHGPTWVRFKDPQVPMVPMVTTVPLVRRGLPVNKVFKVFRDSRESKDPPVPPVPLGRRGLPVTMALMELLARRGQLAPTVMTVRL